MAYIIPIPLDILSRIRKYVRAGNVYAIIVAETHYATANSEMARVIDTKSDPGVSGPTGLKKATLIETSWSAGEFATLEAGDLAAPPDGGLEEFASEWVYCLVVPKSEEIKADWFNKYVRPISGEGDVPTAPFLWFLQTMFINDPVSIQFKIRYAPHIVGGEDGTGTVPMVQMYPMSGTCSAAQGWNVAIYRTDLGTEHPGTGPMFQAPPEWSVNVIAPAFFGDQRGLLFGTNPPLIAADVPYEG